MNLFKNDWDSVLANALQTPFFENVGNFLFEEREKGKTIYPDKTDYFKAFKLTPYSKVKVVILGQDPYPKGEADGLAFSVKNDPSIIKCPASLTAIFEEIENDVYQGFRPEQDWNLERWAVQGVFLLNRILSVEKFKPKSHAGVGWEWFTADVIEALNNHPEPLVFMLWGKEAKDVKPLIKDSKHLVLTSGHPATKFYDNDTWSGNKHFSQCNKFLEENGKRTIEW